MDRQQAGATPLNSSGFRWLLAGRSVDQLGNAVQPIALGFAMLAVFGTPTALGVVVGSNSLGQILLLLAGGVVADRLPRSAVLVWSNVVAGIAQAGIVALILTDVAVLPAYAALAFVTGAAAAFDGPATVALIPEVVEDTDLQRANSYLSVVRHGARIGGAPAAGVLVAAIGAGWTLGVDAASFAVAAVCFSRTTPYTTQTLEVRATSPLEDLRDGWSEFRSHTWLWVVVLAAVVINAAIAGGLFVVGLTIAERTIGAGGWGLAMGAFAAGSLGGAVLGGRLQLERPLLVGLAATTLVPLPLFVLAAEGDAWTLAIATAVSGVVLGHFIVAWETALQRHVPRDRLARVSSIDHLGSIVAMPVGAFVAGPLADVLGEAEVAAGAGILVVLATLGGLASRDVRQLRGIPASAH